MKRTITFLIVLLIAFGSSYAQQWEPMYGPQANNIYCVKQFGNTMLMGSEFGTYRSTDQGASWTKITISSNLYSPAWDFDQTGNKLLVATASGLFSSADNGVTWNHINAIPEQEIRRIAVDGNSIYLAGYCCKWLYRSNDEGNTWEDISYNIPATAYSDIIHTGNRTFLATSGNGAFYLNDGDTAWHALNIADTYVNFIANNNNILYAGTSHGGLLKSTDLGQTWTAENTGFTFLPSVESICFGNNKIWLGTQSGLFESPAAPVSWSPVSEFEHKMILCGTIAGSSYFAGTSSSGLFCTHDNGITWTAVSNGIQTGSSVFHMGGSANDLIAGMEHGSNGLYCSNDKGHTWRPLGMLNYTSALCVKGDTIITGSSYGNSHISTNHGNTWRSSVVPLAHYNVSNDILCAAIVNTAIFIGTWDGLFRSDNGGESWTFITTLWGPVHVLMGDGNDLYAGTDRNLFKSTDLAASWTSCVNGLPASINPYVLRKYNKKIYLGGADGCFVSNDGGDHWKTLMHGLPGSIIHDLVVCNNDLYATVAAPSYGNEAPYGIYKCPGNDTTWLPFNNGLVNLEVKSIFSDGEYLYAGIDWEGIYRYPLGPVAVKETVSDAIGLTLYPNPGNGQLTVESDEEGIKDLTIYDVKGNCIYKEQLTGRTNHIDLSAQARGTYFAEIRSGRKRVAKKIVLE